MSSSSQSVWFPLVVRKNNQGRKDRVDPRRKTLKAEILDKQRCKTFGRC